MRPSRSLPTGYVLRHSRSCGTQRAATCTCKPTYQAWVYSTRDRRKLSRTFKTLSAAKQWRSDAMAGVRRGTTRAAAPVTFRQAAEAWLKGAEEGTVRTRSGGVFKPSSLRSYRAALLQRALPKFGGARLSAITVVDIQDFADRLLAEGLDASTIRNLIMPVRAIYRRAMSRGEVSINPTSGLQLPTSNGRRDRIASPTEAAALIAALTERDQPIWATALYAGLRRGELMGLRWEDIDLKANLIRVERSWDVRAGPVEPKSKAGKRKVPIASVLREHLIQHQLRCGRRAGLVFARASGRPFDDSALAARARTAWTKAGLAPITLHECRHTFASLMIAADVNAKALATYMGHSSVVITYDRYGHLMPGNEDEAARLLDGYLVRSIEAAQPSQIDHR